MKRIVAFFISVLLILSLFSGVALADEEPSAESVIEVESGAAIPEDLEVVIPKSEPIVGETVVIDGDDIGDNDELLMEFMEISLSTNNEPMYSVAGADNLSDINEIVYWAIRDYASSVAFGEMDSTIFTFRRDQLELDGEYSAADLGVRTVFTNGEITAEAKAAMMAKLNEIDLDRVVTALLYDCPAEFFWYEKTIGCRMESSIGIGAKYKNSVGYVLYFSEESEVSFYFPVAEDYAVDHAEGTYIVDSGLMDTIQMAIDNANVIISEHQEESDYQKLISYKDEICTAVSYNTEAGKGEYSYPYGNPWQIIWVFDNDETTNVVCEGYSKAFQFLCDGSDFESDELHSTIVTGIMSGGTGAGPHMWNIVTMGDGNHYLVDVTNCDEGTIGEPDQLFLTGATREISDASGSWGYAFDTLSGEIQYIYDDNTKETYNLEDLKLSSKSYTIDIVEENGLRYLIIDNKATVLGLTTEATDLVIPAMVHDVPVTAIAGDAFCKNKTLQSVVLPDTVVSIEDGQVVFVEDTMSYDFIGAFAGCESLTRVEISEASALEHIGKCAFFGDSLISSFFLPSSLRTIGLSAFEGVPLSESITLPEGLEFIGQDAFSFTGLKSLHLPASLTYFCNWAVMYELKEITVAEGNAYYKSVDGVLYCNESGTDTENWRLCYYPWAKEAEEYVVPDFITELDYESFQPHELDEGSTSPKYLKRIKLSDNQYLRNGFMIGPCLSINDSHPKYTVIDGLVYDKEVKCLLAIPSILTGDIVIRDGVTEIRYYAGYNGNYSSVTIPASVKTIGGYAFEHSLKLERVYFLGAIEEMGDRVFAFCSSLYEIALPQGITEIPPETFLFDSIYRMFIPLSVKKTGRSSFGSYVGELYYEGSAEDWKLIDIENDHPLNWANFHYNVNHADGHLYGNGWTIKESTCTEEGTTARYCLFCGDKITEQTPMLDHFYEIVEGSAVEATCTSDGKEADRRCYYCGDLIEGAVIAKLPHSYGEWVVTKEATCTVAGSREKVCSACGDKVTEEIPAAHKWNDFYTVDKVATYDEDGYESIYCSVCGERKAGSERVIPKLKRNPGWFQEGDTWYYVNNDGTFATGWVKSGSSWYYMDPTTGAMQTGLVTVGNATYYMAASGAMQTGWINDDGTWYYAEGSGALKSGWVQSGSTWYYMDPTTYAMTTGWVKVNGSWYYMKESGAMATGWVKSGNDWYYMSASGVMTTGWVKVGDSWYYMKASGAMAANQWCSGYWLNANGTWTYQPRGSWKKDSTGWWFGDTSGWYAKSTTIKIDGKDYTFDVKGYLVEE